jgi:hypothetical protein
MKRLKNAVVALAMLLSICPAMAENSDGNYSHAVFYYGGGDSEGNCGAGTYIEFGTGWNDYWDFPWLANNTSTQVQGERYFGDGRPGELARVRTFACYNGVVYTW